MRPSYYIGQLLYYELNIDYIIDTYCVNKDKPQLNCNGKCYLSQQLQKATPTQEANDFNTHGLLNIFYPVFLTQAVHYSLSPNHHLIDSKNENNYYFDNYSYLLGNSLLRPPITAA